MPSNVPVRATIHHPRWTASILLALFALVAACAPTPPAPTPASTPSTAASASPSPSLDASPTATSTTVATPSPTPKPTAASPSPTASPPPSPITLPAFTTSAPPKTGAAWTGISWHKLKAGDSFGKVRSVVRWRGGFVALGAVVTTGDTWRTPVWISTDGLTWRPLAVDVFGPTTIVLGVGETAHGVVVLTLQSGTNTCQYSPAEFSCAALAGPLQSWTSPDAVTWTAHPGPTGMALPAVGCDECGVDVPIFRAGSPGLLVSNRSGKLVLSRDGIAWQAVPASAFPAHFQFADIAAFGSGFIAVGDSGGSKLRAMALASSDGRRWVAHYLPNLTADRTLGTVAGGILAGPSGVIVAGGNGGAGGAPIWWTSTTGKTWLRFLGYPPLGSSKGGPSCEAGCGGWPNGVVLADGVRMLAYHGGTKPVAWGSSDGRTWRKIVVGRTHPSLGEGPIQDMILLPNGLLWIGTDGSVWFGRPTT